MLIYCKNSIWGGGGLALKIVLGGTESSETIFGHKWFNFIEKYNVAAKLAYKCIKLFSISEDAKEI